MDVRVGLQRKPNAEEVTLDSPLDCKEIKPVNPKANQSWLFIGRTDAEAETPILWPPDAKNWLIWKDPDAGKDWRQEEKGMLEDEMVRRHHWFDGHEFEEAPGVGDGQGSLVCCSSWGHKESDMTEQLDWTELSVFKLIRLLSLLLFKSLVRCIICKLFLLVLSLSSQGRKATLTTLTKVTTVISTEYNTVGMPN